MSGCAARTDPLARSRLAFGVGDRISLESDTGWRFAPDVAAAHGLPLDLFAIWLPRGWDESWVGRDSLRRLVARGTTPVLIHYYFGDDISRESLAAEREAWLASITRMAGLADIGAPVLIVLEPEFNTKPPQGQHSVLAGPQLARALREAVRILRARAPEARIGTCAGDFPGTPGIERALAPVASELDFIAFQEMRARGAPHADRRGYLDVADSAVAYARGLQRSFELPILLAYVAISSHGGWEARQAEVLRRFAPRLPDLEAAGVFGLLYFQLRDDPNHRGYFGSAERHFGLLRRDGSPKPALRAFRDLARQRSP